MAVNLEAHPEDVSLIYPEDGIIVHTNHFVGDRAFNVKDKFVLSETSSINRFILAKELMSTSRVHNIESFKNILSNHFDYPTSICHHPNKDNDKDQWEETISSIYMVPEARIFMFTEGPPCTNLYKRVSF